MPTLTLDEKTQLINDLVASKQTAYSTILSVYLAPDEINYLIKLVEQDLT